MTFGSRCPSIDRSLLRSFPSAGKLIDPMLLFFGVLILPNVLRVGPASLFAKACGLSQSKFINHLG